MASRSGGIKKRQRRKARQRTAVARDLKRRDGELKMRARLTSDWAPVIDVMFTNLDAELRQWPDDWEVARHGTIGPLSRTATANPHVWFPMKRAEEATISAYFQRRGHTEVPIGTLRCTCGLTKPEFDEIQQLLAVVASPMAMMLGGLIARDVQ